MKKMNNKGFSLIELIIVIAIMAVLVAIIAPNLTKYLGSSKQKTDDKNIDEVEQQVKNTISDATISDVTVTAGTYFLNGADATKGMGVKKSGAGTYTYSTDATNSFEKLLAVNLQDGKTVSKQNTSNKYIKVEITGSESAGYKVKASFVASDT